MYEIESNVVAVNTIANSVNTRITSLASGSVSSIAKTARVGSSALSMPTISSSPVNCNHSP